MLGSCRQSTWMPPGWNRRRLCRSTCTTLPHPWKPMQSLDTDLGMKEVLQLEGTAEGKQEGVSDKGQSSSCSKLAA